MVNKHSSYDLKQMQAVPLEQKIAMTKRRIREWYDYWDGMVYVSFSGGKDSTVLKHIVDSMHLDVPAVFVNTGLEYPEIQKFVRDMKAGKYDCFNSDIEILRPEMRFDEVVKKYGYPVASKEVSRRIYYARKAIQEGRHENHGDYLHLTGEAVDKEGRKSRYNCSKWFFLLDAPFKISPFCCDVMKKNPIKKYKKQTGRKTILGMMANESALRMQAWIRNGCNAFNSKDPTSSPMSFWTEQDVLHYIKKFNVPYASVYGDIVPTSKDEQIEGQLTAFDVLNDYETTQLKTTGANRTGCIFCMFGCHLEKEPNRFQRLKETHPRQYEYCINGGEMVDGKWQPSKEGLGLGKVLDYINVKYK